MNDLPRALYYFERSTEYSSDVFYAHYRAGEILMIKNDLESALSHFRKALEMGDAQEKQKVLIKIYQTLCYLNRAEEGKDILAYFKKMNQNKGIPVPPRGSYLNYIPLQVKRYVDSAKEAMAKNEDEKAIELLSASLETYETSVVYRMLGDLYLNKKDFEKSRQYLMKAYPDFQFDPAFLSSLIRTDLSVQKQDEARKVLEQLKRVDPKYPELRLLELAVAMPAGSGND
jgi:tetratricopeptide (TPR) repeat protein